jgi:LysR family hydrogen peroxide-inducible transcriptional activator
LLKKHNLTSEDLNGNQMWLLKDGHCFKSQVANFCTLDKTHDSVMSNVHFQSGSLEVLRSLVRDSEGYTVIPALMVSKMPAGEIKEHVRPFRAPIPTREISFIYRRDHWKLDIIRSIEENIVEHLPDEIKTTHTKKEKVLPL